MADIRPSFADAHANPYSRPIENLKVKDLLNDLEKSENIKKRIQEQLEQNIDQVRTFEEQWRDRLDGRLTTSSVTTFITVPNSTFSRFGVVR